MSTFNPAHVESLEPRLALALGSGAQELYYPEGFANGHIVETVSIFNPGMATVEFELWARYETGQRDQLIRSGTINPGEWAGVLVSDPADPAAIAVRPDAPFSFVLRSDGELNAMLQHDDFGASAAESFVAFGSTSWSLPSVAKLPGVRDFIVAYNPNPVAVTVLIEFYSDSGLAFSLSGTIEPYRRGGWNIAKLAGLPQGNFGVRVESSADIVLGHSHYDLNDLVAAINIATFDRGSLAGALLSPERSGAHPFMLPATLTLVAVFNPGETDAHVTLNYIVRDGGSLPAPTDLLVPAHGRRWVTLDQLGLASRDVSIIWESDVRVSAAAFSRGMSTYVVSPSTRVAATEWFFAAAFVDRVNASVMDTEDVLAFNPTDHDIEVKFTFVFRNGSSATQTIVVAPFAIGASEVRMPVQHIGAGHPFTVKIEADGPVVAALESWNHRRISGRFPSSGIPAGVVSSLSDVLVVP